ncbi:MAG: efflux RND transporter periplasmic adaptor subunit [Xanthomonadaceae bacterium]|nr:efflux RND transporter periplasmic adaptor subunit [Xanthomonadaceae bacterium]
MTATLPVRRLALVAALSIALLATACSKAPTAADPKASAATADATTADKGKDAAAKGKDKDKPAEVAVPVEVALVSRRAMSASYGATASLEAAGEAQVVSLTSGVLLKLLAEEGDVVQAGQVLARLDPDRKGLALAQSQAQLKKLESEYSRSKELFAKQLVSADAHEKIRSELDVQRAAVDITKLELSYTTITAPISGVVAQRMVKVGNLIQPNAPMFKIVDTSRLEAVLNVPERELDTLRAGLPVTMRVDALPGRSFNGKVGRVSPVVDAGSGTFRVTAIFEGIGQLKPGMFGRVDIVFDQRPNALTIPRDALLEGDGETSVFAVRDGKAVRVPVQVGFITGSYAEIRAGLAEGDGVVTVGKVTLRDGATVEVVNGGDGAGTVATKGDNTMAASQ